MVILFKDYNKQPLKLYSLRKWLNSRNVCFSAGCETNWPNQLENILRNPEIFFKNGGWSYCGKIEEQWSDYSWPSDDEKTGRDEQKRSQGEALVVSGW